MHKLGASEIGGDRPVYFVAELGINHQGDFDIARRMVDAAAKAGAQAVKTQMRTLDRVYTPAEMGVIRPGLWGTTNGDLKRKLELTLEQHARLAEHANSVGLDYATSPWDETSAAVAQGVCDWIKVPSPRIGHLPMLKVLSSFEGQPFVPNGRSEGARIVLSSGMSTIDEVDRAADLLGDRLVCLMHCVSQYPQTMGREQRAHRIRDMAKVHDVVYGYSGHEPTIMPTIGEFLEGALVIERHVTLDRAMWGSDQAASLTFDEFGLLIREIRAIEGDTWQESGDDGVDVHPVEMAARDKLWRTTDL